MSEDNKETVDAFEQLEQRLDTSNKDRDKMLNKLMGGFEGFDEDIEGMSPSSRESFSAIVNSMAGLLNNKDSANINMVKIKLQQQKNETEANSAENVATFLRSVKMNGVTITGVPGLSSSAEVDSNLDKEFEASGETISDGELMGNDEV